MALMLPVHVGATSAAARDAMRPGVLKYYRNLEAIFSQLPDVVRRPPAAAQDHPGEAGQSAVREVCRDQGVFGDAAEVVDRLQAARDEFGLSQIICWFDQGSSCRGPRSSARCGGSPTR